MGLKNKEKTRISREEILEKVDECQLFSYYHGPFSFKKGYHSVFRRDRNSSCGFYVNKAGKIIYNDIATGEKLDCFAFVAKKYNLTYGQALYKIGCDFGILDCKSPKIDINSLKKIEEYEEELARETEIEIEYADWDFAALEYWKQYHITEEELKKNDVYNIKKLRINGKIIPNYKGDLRFAYCLEYEGKIYKKIYQPEGAKKFKWINSIPLHIFYGYNKLPYTSDILILTKAVKDLICVKKFHSDCGSLQNESESALKDVTLDFLKKKYKRIIVFTDNDEPGIRAAEKYRERGCEAYYLDDSWKNEGCKDMADICKIHGIEYLKQYLNLIFKRYG